MCIDDLDYQHFRQQVRAADWQKAFLNKPLGEREAIAQGLRHQSERSKQEKSMAIMDVNTQAVHEFVAKQGIQTLIHGHTHRPGRHNASFTRWVLPDWDLARKRGGWLRWDRTGLTSQGPFGAWA
jgi:UDP-2,3-diacylglucosamine hydrolase